MNSKIEQGGKWIPSGLSRGIAGGLILSITLATQAVFAAPGVEKLRLLDSDKRIDGQYIVVLDKSTFPGQGNGPPSQARDAVASISLDLTHKYGGVVDRRYSHALKGFAVHSLSHGQATRLANDPLVAFVEADQEVTLNVTQSPATWGLDRSDQVDLPLDNSYTYSFNGAGVHAYVVDTGINTSHTDFGGRASESFTSISDGNGAQDCNGHGTHVAGTVGSATWGVAKAVNLYAVRVLDCGGSGTNSGVIAGVDWVAANHTSPAVANMSLGGGASSALDSAVATAVASGVTFVVAAGNENQNACNVSPSREPSAITVGSTTSSDARSSFSNFGTCVDIFAPGSSITSTWSTSNSATNTISGTSMASPHVAGAAALYLDEDSTATPTMVTDAIIAAASQGKVSSAGSGSPNLLLNMNFGAGTPPPPPPPGGGQLNNGDSVANLSGSTGSWQYFTIDVPAGATNLQVVMSGGSGDADLYLRFGSQPTTSSYDCRPYSSGNNESCPVASPSAGTYHIGINAFSSYSGVTLTVSYTEPTGGGTGGSISDTNISASRNSWVDYTIEVPAGMSTLEANISGGSGDADLYVRFGNFPTTSTYDCRPFRSGNNETCTFTNPQAGTWYISLRAYTSFSGVDMITTYTP